MATAASTTRATVIRRIRAREDGRRASPNARAYRRRASPRGAGEGRWISPAHNPGREPPLGPRYRRVVGRQGVTYRSAPKAGRNALQRRLSGALTLAGDGDAAVSERPRADGSAGAQRRAGCPRPRAQNVCPMRLETRDRSRHPHQDRDRKALNLRLERRPPPSPAVHGRPQRTTAEPRSAARFPRDGARWRAMTGRLSTRSGPGSSP
jgi:hypothetical protein